MKRKPFRVKIDAPIQKDGTKIHQGTNQSARNSITTSSYKENVRPKWFMHCAFTVCDLICSIHF